MDLPLPPLESEAEDLDVEESLPRRHLADPPPSPPHPPLSPEGVKV